MLPQALRKTEEEGESMQRPAITLELDAEKALKRKEAAVVQGAQNLKDSAGSLGADRIFDLSCRLETHGIENRLSEGKTILRELSVAVEELSSLLKEVR